MLAKVSRSIVASPSIKRSTVCYNSRLLPTQVLATRSLLLTQRWLNTSLKQEPSSSDHPPQHLPEHAVISTFDLFSIGVGPSSSHTVGPMRAGRIFITDLKELNLLEKVSALLHHTPQAILLGLEGAKFNRPLLHTGSDPETIDTGTIPSRYVAIQETKTLMLGGYHRIHYDMDRDMLWRYDLVLKTHPNGMRFSCFDEDGTLLATNEYFSVGGGFVVNEKTKVDENLFYKSVDKKAVHGARLHQSHSLGDPLAPLLIPGGEGETYEQVYPVSTTNEDKMDNEKGGEREGNGTCNGQLEPPYPFDTGATLLALTHKHNMTIAQIVHDNEKYFGYSEEEIHEKLMRIWQVMDECIRTGVSTSERTLPGRLGLRRRAPMLYRRLMRGFYPGVASPAFDFPAIGPGSSKAADAISVETNETPESQLMKRKVALAKLKKVPRILGSVDHAIMPMAPRRTVVPAMDFLSCYAIAVNEVNASGGRIVTSPTNGAAGVIPFVSDDPVRSIETFLLTAAAVGMLFKRGSTISAAEGGCQAEVGVACSMASAGFAACMGASPETVLQAAEIGIVPPPNTHALMLRVMDLVHGLCDLPMLTKLNLEHNLGLTCDPIDGLVQVPCIVRDSLFLPPVKAVTAAQLSMASHGVYSVTLDEAIEAMRLTAADMSVKYKETSLSVCLLSVFNSVGFTDLFNLNFIQKMTLSWLFNGSELVSAATSTLRVFVTLGNSNAGRE
ncbi:L-serine dehydratase 2 [Leucoagaricus sp. SymC.cos]|nr:L-serine dehydratase 2 [Leucoagaricus sp. SymC.cos]